MRHECEPEIRYPVKVLKPEDNPGENPGDHEAEECVLAPKSLDQLGVPARFYTGGFCGR